MYLPATGRIIFSLVITLLYAHAVDCKAVFAHFMVTNTINFTTPTWQAEMQLAQEANIDAFALNMAWQDPANDNVEFAFKAAFNLGFKLFFSFDYAGNGAWDADVVTAMIQTWSKTSSYASAYFTDGGQPLVSTFEGPANSADWTAIKSDTNCLFIPDWSSLGAKLAVEKGTADGLFSWAAWPYGPNGMNTYPDASYQNFLTQGMKYMMPVSPWFFTNLPGFPKNWIWRGDSLWHDRWEQILWFQPDYVEIISWNDFGESHYIGPLQNAEYDAFDVGKAPYNYVLGMPHDGWRRTLPYYIQMYKTGTATISTEELVVWYRLTPGAACGTGQTSGNTASQYQVEYEPYDVAQDYIFFNAVLGSSADVSVTIGGVAVEASWSSTPYGGVGVYNGSAPVGQHTGSVVVTITRGVSILSVSGEAITTSCTDDITNWNAWVGYDTGSVTVNASPTLNLADQNCTAGWGASNFEGLCGYTCDYGYCPSSACMCTQMGLLVPTPTPSYDKGYPIAGEGSSYLGLCAFACNLDYCPDTACGPVSVPLTEPVVSPFTPPSCTSGESTSDPNYGGLCSYSCGYGYCPIDKCTCLSQGVLVLPPDADGTSSGTAIDSTDQSGLCQFTCQRGYCPPGACTDTSPPATSPAEFFDAGHCSDGDPTHDYLCYTCENSTSRINLNQTNQQLWVNSLAQESLTPLFAAYNEAYKNDKLQNFDHWTRFVAYFYNVTLDVECYIGAQSSNCVQDLECENEPYTLAASKVISSMVRLTVFYNSWYNNLDDVLSQWALVSDDFKSTFAPDPTKDLLDNIIDQVADMAFDAIGGKIFNFLWKSLPKGDADSGVDDEDSKGADLAEQAFDAAYGAFTDAIMSEMKSGATQPTGSDISNMLTYIVQLQQAALKSYGDMLFASDGSGQEAFAKQVNAGTWLTAQNTSLADMQTETKGYVLSGLLPMVWTFGSRYAVIVMSKTTDDTSNPFEGNGINDDEAKSARLNLDGSTFWLVGQNLCEDFSPRLTSCDEDKFVALDGLDALNGTNAKWGNLNMDDIIASSYYGYKLNGYANGYNISTAANGTLTNSNGDVSQFPYPSGYQTPGLFSIPVCDLETVLLNWAAFGLDERRTTVTKPCDTYPCCTCDYYDLCSE